jgi:hypothetical protein
MRQSHPPRLGREPLVSGQLIGVKAHEERAVAIDPLLEGLTRAPLAQDEHGALDKRRGGPPNGSGFAGCRHEDRSAGLLEEVTQKQTVERTPVNADRGVGPGRDTVERLERIRVVQHCRCVFGGKAVGDVGDLAGMCREEIRA